MPALALAVALYYHLRGAVPAAYSTESRSSVSPYSLDPFGW